MITGLLKMNNLPNPRPPSALRGTAQRNRYGMRISLLPSRTMPLSVTNWWKYHVPLRQSLALIDENAPLVARRRGEARPKGVAKLPGVLAAVGDSAAVPTDCQARIPNYPCVFGPSDIPTELFTDQASSPILCMTTASSQRLLRPRLPRRNRTPCVDGQPVWAPGTPRR